MSTLQNNGTLTDRPLPDPDKMYMTAGVAAWAKPRLHLTYLASRVQEAYEQQPDTVTDGGNDKFFFSTVIHGQRFFVAANEIGGLTIMLPEEY